MPNYRKHPAPSGGKKTTLMDRRVPKQKNRTGKTSAGNIEKGRKK